VNAGIAVHGCAELPAQVVLVPPSIQVPLEQALPEEQSASVRHATQYPGVVVVLHLRPSAQSVAVVHDDWQRLPTQTGLVFPLAEQSAVSTHSTQRLVVRLQIGAEAVVQSKELTQVFAATHA
jgi:hypothetical protein